MTTTDVREEREMGIVNRHPKLTIDRQIPSQTMPTDRLTQSFDRMTLSTNLAPNPLDPSTSHPITIKEMSGETEGIEGIPSDDVVVVAPAAESAQSPNPAKQSPQTVLEEEDDAKIKPETSEPATRQGSGSLPRQDRERGASNTSMASSQSSCSVRHLQIDGEDVEIKLRRRDRHGYAYTHGHPIPPGSGPNGGTASTRAYGQTNWNKLNPETNIYISNLPGDLTESQLHEMMAPFGRIARLRLFSPVNAHHAGNSSSYALVQYQRVDEADRAMKSLKNHRFSDGRRMQLQIAMRRRSSLSEEPTNLYIRGLPVRFTEDDVITLFRKYGNILQTRMSEDGIAFVRFENHDQAMHCIDKMNRREMEGKLLEVKFATRKYAAEMYQNKFPVMGQGTNDMSELSGPSAMSGGMAVRENKNNLYVRNLPIGLTQVSLEKMFSKFGTISSAKLNDTGVAFVRFVRPEDATKAIAALDKKINTWFKRTISGQISLF